MKRFVLNLFCFCLFTLRNGFGLFAQVTTEPNQVTTLADDTTHVPVTIDNNQLSTLEQQNKQLQAQVQKKEAEFQTLFRLVTDLQNKNDEMTTTIENHNQNLKTIQEANQKTNTDLQNEIIALKNDAINHSKTIRTFETTIANLTEANLSKSDSIEVLQTDLNRAETRNEFNQDTITLLNKKIKEISKENQNLKDTTGTKLNEVEVKLNREIIIRERIQGKINDCTDDLVEKDKDIKALKNQIAENNELTAKVNRLENQNAKLVNDLIKESHEKKFIKRKLEMAEQQGSCDPEKDLIHDLEREFKATKLSLKGCQNSTEYLSRDMESRTAELIKTKASYDMITKRNWDLNNKVVELETANLDLKFSLATLQKSDKSTNENLKDYKNTLAECLNRNDQVHKTSVEIRSINQELSEENEKIKLKMKEVKLENTALEFENEDLAFEKMAIVKNISQIEDRFLILKGGYFTKFLWRTYHFHNFLFFFYFFMISPQKMVQTKLTTPKQQT